VKPHFKKLAAGSDFLKPDCRKDSNMADLATVRTFFDNADAYSSFLHRVEAAVVEAALDIRAEEEPDPMTGLFQARQQLALQVLTAPSTNAKRFLPALAIKANAAGLMSESGEISATDEQIRSVVADLFAPYSNYVPE
jgi:hypothetical protein